MITNYMFDLDCTLLHFNQDLFLEKYFMLIHKRAVKNGKDGKKMMELVFDGTKKMIENDGSRSNEEAFWSVFGEERKELEPFFDGFYDEEYNELKSLIIPSKKSIEILSNLKEQGKKIVLATNPLFPRKATIKRMEWGGIDPLFFSYITTYENAHFSKPNHLYYEEIMKTLNLDIEKTMMIGNDLEDDFSDINPNLKHILITDYQINKKNRPITMPSYTQSEFLLMVQKDAF